MAEKQSGTLQKKENKHAFTSQPEPPSDDATVSLHGSLSPLVGYNDRQGAGILTL